MILRQDDVQAAGLAHRRVQLDIGAAAGHVGRDRDPPRLTGAGDDLGLLAILSRIEDRRVASPASPSNCADMLGGVDRASADQHGPACAGHGGHGFDDGVPFELSRCKDTRARIRSAQRPIGRYAHDPQAVDGAQLARRLERRSGHAAKVQVAAKEPLIGDPRQRLAPFGDGAAFLGLDELVHAALPRAVGHDAPGVLVDDLHLAVGDDVLHVAVEQVERGKRLLNEFLARAPNGPQTRQSRR